MKKIIILIAAVGLIAIAGIVFLFSYLHADPMLYTVPRGMFPRWNGYDISYGRYGGPEDIVCIVQYMYYSDNSGREIDYGIVQRARTERKKYMANGEGDYPLLSYVPVKAYADKDMIKKIISKLHSPEYREGRNINIETEDYLLLIGIDRKLDSQFIIRVPFKLAEDGYVVTPRGRDRELYELLNSALKDWVAQRKAEKDRLDAIYRLYSQARESEKVDYKSLFLELKKLDALFGAKDPNELEQRIKDQKEALRQEQLLYEEAKKKETKPIF